MGKWTAENMPDLTGKTIVVTGGNSGLGLDASQEFARKGATLVLACRNLDKAQVAVDAIKQQTPDAKVMALQLDLANLASVRSFLEAFEAYHESLDVLCNNAGVMALPYRKTEDGFEMQFGTNHLGHFALTGLLLPALNKSPAARVVNVSSMAHRVGKMRFEDLAWEQSYGKWRAYGMSKLANLLFTYELQRRLEKAGSSTISTACHPGYAETNLQTAGPLMEGSKFMASMAKWMSAVAAQSSQMGALPTLYASTAEDVLGGDYIGPDGAMESSGFPVKVDSSKRSKDEAAAAQLWTVSEELTGVSYGL